MRRVAVITALVLVASGCKKERPSEKPRGTCLTESEPFLGHALEALGFTITDKVRHDLDGIEVGWTKSYCRTGRRGALVVQACLWTRERTEWHALGPRKPIPGEVIVRLGRGLLLVNTIEGPPEAADLVARALLAEDRDRLHRRLELGECEIDARGRGGANVARWRTRPDVYLTETFTAAVLATRGVQLRSLDWAGEGFSLFVREGLAHYDSGPVDANLTFRLRCETQLDRESRAWITCALETRGAPLVFRLPTGGVAVAAPSPDAA